MSSGIDYELESIHIGFEAGQADALSAWQTVFEETRNQWQTDRARRLLQILKSNPMNDATLSVVKYYEATLFVNVGEWARARKAFEQAILLSRKVRDAIGELRAINGLANLLRRSADNLDSAEELFHSALQSNSFDSSGRLALLNGRGLILYERGDLEQAQACFEEVLDLAKQSGDQELIASVYHNLGSIAWTRGRLQESRELLLQALELQRATQDLHGEAETLNSLGLLEEGFGEWEQAIETYRLALERMEQAGDVYGQSQVLVNLGNVYSLRQENDRAFSYLEQAYAIAKELGNPRLQGQALTALGDMHRSKGELEKAVEVLNWAMEVKIKSGESRSLKHNWLSLGAVYHQLKQPRMAQEAYEQALEIARKQNDRRMMAVILTNQSALSTVQENFQAAGSFLKEARALALEGEYHDCLAWIYEQEGDLELLDREPSSAHILESYTLALWHACHFNEYELDKLIHRLSRFWLAHAEDGEGQVAIWFCDSIIQLWQNNIEPGMCPIVVEEFTQLRKKIVGTMVN